MASKKKAYTPELQEKLNQFNKNIGNAMSKNLNRAVLEEAKKDKAKK